MKEVICTARNITIAVSEGDNPGITPMVEAIIVVTEPQYRIKKGEIVRMRQPETLRFAASPDSLRTIAKSFMEWADQAEAVAMALGAKKVETSREQPQPPQSP